MLIRAINRWQELLKIYSEGDENKWFSIVRELNENIKLAISLDETYVTALMIMKHSLDIYTANLEIPFSVLVKDRNSLFKFLEEYDKLNKVLLSKDISDTIESFRKSIVDTVNKNSIPMDDDMIKLLEDDNLLAELRLSALDSANKLTVNQFSSGSGDFSDISFSHSILEFDDINTLLLYLKSSMAKDGISLHLVRDVEDYRFSYFMFVIKRGENIYTVSDKSKLPSVNYRQSGRGKGKDRSFSDRISEHLFPYDIVVKWSDKRSAYVQTSNEYAKSITLHKSCWRPVGSIDDIGAPEKLWTVLVLSILQGRYFAENAVQLNELSYTNMMAHSGQETTESALVLRTPFSDTELSLKYSHVDLGIINTHSDIEEYGDIWDSPPLGIYKWMEKRYKNRIPKYSATSLLRAPGENIEILLEDKSLVSNRTPGKWEWFEGDKGIKLADVRLNDYGTKDEILQSVGFASRHAAAMMVYSLALEEYEERKEELKKWYMSAIESNMSEIEKSIGKGELIVERTSYRSDGDEVSFKNILYIYSKDEKSSQPSWHWNIRFYQGSLYRNDTIKCYFTGKQATWRVHISPESASELATVLGLKISELPDVFQNYTKDRPYAGNNILRTLDPMDNIRDPFSEKFNFNIVIHISKSHLNKLRKLHGEHKST